MDEESTHFEHVSLPGDGEDRGAAEELIERLSGRAGTHERYELKEEVARGGQGAVLRVFDGDLRRHLAMKVVLEGQSAEETSPQTLGRFLEEAQVTGQLDHPGIVPVHELGLDSGGRVYFTMKLVRGRDLRTIFDLVHTGKEGWTVTRALGVILKVCEAMAYAHAKGVIHRDLKPGNVMVGRYGEVYVMDWGLARVLGTKDRRDLRIDADLMTTRVRSDRRDQADDPESPLMTMDGDVVGTPAYMPPEQALGDLESMGPHSDVYAVGAMLYHLLAGHVPYVSPGMRVNGHAIWALVQQGPPQRLDEAAGDAPAELVAICEMAMARDVEARYPDMQALADDLRAYLENRVVGAHRTGAVTELKKWVQRNRGLAGATAAAAALLVVGTIVSSSLFVQARASAELALDNEAEARWQSYVANIGAANGRLDAGAAADAAARLAACPEEHRGWEWDYLKNRVDASLASERISESFLWSVAWSPDGEYLAVLHGRDGDFGERGEHVSLHDAGTLALIREFEPLPQAFAGALAFSPTGTEVCAGTITGQAFVWDVETGERVAHWNDLQDHVWIMDVAYHPAGLLIAFATYEGVYLWDVFADEVEWRIDSDPCRSVAFSPDGSVLASGHEGGRVRRFDVGTGAEQEGWNLAQIVGDELGWFGVLDLEYAAAGNELLAATGSGVAVRLAEGGALTHVLRGHQRPATAARYGPDEHTVLTTGLDGTVRIWDARSSQPLEVLHGHDGFVTDLDLSPARDRIVTASFDHTLRLWDSAPGSVVTRLRGAAGGNFKLYQMAFDPSGEKVAWLWNPVRVQVADARSGLQLFVLPEASDWMNGMAFTADGRLMTITDKDYLRVWDAETGALLDVVGEPEERWFVDFSPDRALYAAGVTRAGESYVVVRSTTSGELVHEWRTESTPWNVLFTPDGGRLVTRENGGTASVFDLATGDLLRTLELRAHGGTMALGPEGRLLASIVYDPAEPSIRIHDLETGKLVRRLAGHALPAVLAFHPDGRRLLVGNWYEGSMTLFDLEQGEIVSLHGLGSTVRELQLSPDGARIASAEDGGLYQIWETTSAAERAEARAHAARERIRERHARPIVDAVFQRVFTPEQAVEQLLLETDPALTDDVRATAIRLARCRGFDTRDDMGLTIGLVCIEPGRPEQDYENGLEWLQALPRMRRDVESTTPWIAATALALYRLGRYEEALAHLERLQPLPTSVLRSQRIFSERVGALCLAMTQHRLGHSQEARAALAEARTLMQQVFVGSELAEPALKRLLEEAEQRIEGE